jgi:hypothetical protein
MNKIVQIKVFNDILDQLFDYLECNFSFYKSDIILARSTMEFIRKGNPRLVVEQFMQYVGPYRKHISECNEDFFLNFDKNLNKNELSIQNMLTGLKIKNMWTSPDTTDHQKAFVWLYFQKLLKAGSKVF